MQVYEKALQILLKEANVAIKYRVTGEICNNINSTEYIKLKCEMEKSERAMSLLEYLINRKEYHGATLMAVENSLNMLIDMGFIYNRGFIAFDKAVDELVQEVSRRKADGNHMLRYLPDIVVIPFLLRAGVREAWMIEFVKERIDLIYDFIKEKNYDIYDARNGYKRIPQNFQNRSIIRPELCENGQIKLPLEYDVYGFACLYTELSDTYKSRIDEIISYIMDIKFQRIEDGYGVVSDKKNYWALGWDPKPTDLEKEYCYNPLLLKMEMLSRFNVAVESEWFLQALKVVERYKDDDGIYHYPKNYLTEKNSCWILGNHMGLGENRRYKEALMMEGTFRTLKILKNFQDRK